MTKPERRTRRNPKPRRVVPPIGDLGALIGRVVYKGSVNHKLTRSFAGAAPHPRPDANICPPHLSGRRDEIQGWLEEAIRQGHVGHDWRGDFPHKIWCRQDGVVYEAVGDRNGEYHGYPLEPDQDVIGLP